MTVIPYSKRDGDDSVWGETIYYYAMTSCMYTYGL